MKDLKQMINSAAAKTEKTQNTLKKKSSLKNAD